MEALAAEGRAYGQTPDGEELSRRLARSEFVSRLRSAWEIVAFGVAGGDASTATFPSAAVQAFARAVMQPSFEARMRRAMGSRREGST
jgi:hypothetical protein